MKFCLLLVLMSCAPAVYNDAPPQPSPEVQIIQKLKSELDNKNQKIKDLEKERDSFERAYYDMMDRYNKCSGGN